MIRKVYKVECVGKWTLKMDEKIIENFEGKEVWVNYLTRDFESSLVKGILTISYAPKELIIEISSEDEFTRIPLTKIDKIELCEDKPITKK